MVRFLITETWGAVADKSSPHFKKVGDVIILKLNAGKRRLIYNGGRCVGGFCVQLCKKPEVKPY